MTITITNQVSEHPGQLPATMPDHVLAMVQRLVETFDPERVYLFGSHARGDHLLDSDYDFMVVVTESDRPSYEHSQIAHQALQSFPVAKDILVWNLEQFDKRLHLVASLPATIVREGILLYCR